MHEDKLDCRVVGTPQPRPGIRDSAFPGDAAATFTVSLIITFSENRLARLKRSLKIWKFAVCTSGRVVMYNQQAGELSGRRTMAV